MQPNFTSLATLTPVQFPKESSLPSLNGYLDRLPIQRLNKQLYLPVARVVWIGTQYRMVYAFTDLQRHPLDFGLDELSEMLDPVQFFRIHRSTIVNLRKIEKISNLSDGRCKLVMQDKTGSAIVVSRYRAMEFKKAYNNCARLQDETLFTC
ncbi:LytTR family transcriptional regulator [candidate division KSB1 bacterium]|nr:LytTR family transcriptional regulator [candidate division KSB1 bacterium]